MELQVYRCDECEHRFVPEDAVGPVYECIQCGQFSEERRCADCNRFMARAGDFGCPECFHPVEATETGWEENGVLYASQAEAEKEAEEAPKRAEKAAAMHAEFMARQEAREKEERAAQRALLPVLAEISPLLSAAPRLQGDLRYVEEQFSRSERSYGTPIVNLWFEDIALLLAPEMKAELGLATDWKQESGIRRNATGAVREEILRWAPEGPVRSRMDNFYTGGAGLGVSVFDAAEFLREALRRKGLLP